MLVQRLHKATRGTANLRNVLGLTGPYPLPPQHVAESSAEATARRRKQQSEVLQHLKDVLTDDNIVDVAKLGTKLYGLSPARIYGRFVFDVLFRASQAYGADAGAGGDSSDSDISGLPELSASEVQTRLVRVAPLLGRLVPKQLVQLAQRAALPWTNRSSVECRLPLQGRSKLLRLMGRVLDKAAAASDSPDAAKASAAASKVTELLRWVRSLLALHSRTKLDAGWVTELDQASGIQAKVWRYWVEACCKRGGRNTHAPTSGCECALSAGGKRGFGSSCSPTNSDTAPCGRGTQGVHLCPAAGTCVCRQGLLMLVHASRRYYDDVATGVQSTARWWCWQRREVIVHRWQHCGGGCRVGRALARAGSRGCVQHVAGCLRHCNSAAR